MIKKKTRCTNFLYIKQVSLCEHPYSWLHKTLSHDLGLRPFKIVSFISNNAKWLGGVNTGYPQEKPPRLTRNNILSHTWPDQCPNPQ